MSDAIQAVRAVIKDYETAVRAGDVDAYVGLFAKDAIQMPPAAADRFGRDEIRAGMTAPLTQNTMDVRFRSLETLILGDYATVRVIVLGTATPKSGGAYSPIDFSVLYVMRAGENGYEIVQEMWTSR